MEEVNREVSKIQTQLHSSRRQLQALETKAPKSITSEVDGIRLSLRKADNRIEDISSQAQSFIKRLDDVEFANITVNMDPQMTWLNENLGKIVKDLEEAHSKTEGAISCTNELVYRALDVKQDVDFNNNKLTEYFDTATDLLNDAQAEVAASEGKLKVTQTSIFAKQREINQKNSLASSKRLQKAQLERQCQDKRNEIAQARRERKDRKEQAIASGVGRGSCCSSGLQLIE
jgi:chromosome segregation ATPase